MSDWMPNLSPDQMRAVMARQPLPPAGLPPGAAPPIGPGGMPVGSATSPGVMPAPGTSSPPAVAPVPRVPAALPVNEQQAQIPRPSDDPGISPEMRKALQPTQDANAALNTEQGRYQDLSNKVQNLKPPSYEDYKPPLWKRLIAPAIGALAGRNAEPVVSSMLDAPYERAQKGFEQQKSQLQQQIEAERGIAIPLAESRARVAQEGFQNTLATQREGREQTAFNNEPTGRMPEVRTGPDGQPHYFQKTKGGQEIEVPEPANITKAHEQENVDSNTPAPGARPEPDPANKGQYRVKTKGGGYVPWAPRTPEEGAMVGDPRATSLFNREHPGREPKAPPEEGVMTAPERAEFDRKTRRFNGEITNLHREETGLIGMTTQPGAPFTAPKSPPSKVGDVATDSEGKALAFSADGKIWGPPKSFADKRADAIKARLDELYGNLDQAEKDILAKRQKTGTQSGATFTVDPRWPAPKNETSMVRDPATKKVFAKAVKGTDGKLTWGPPR